MTTAQPPEGSAPTAPGTGTAACPAPALSIIVVSFNTADMTVDCLQSVVDQTTDTDYELIVIDNASDDDSADRIAAAFPGIRLIRSPDNLGFARANNVAAREARGEYLLLLNPDTLVLDGAIDRLMAFARARPEARIWGARTLFGDRSLNRTSCFRQMSPWTLFCQITGLNVFFPRSEWLNPESYGAWDRGEERAVDIVSGCCLLLPRALWEALDGFDERFVMYAEEADLCLRARDRGARPRVTPEATIVHYGGASQKVRAERMIRLLRAKRTMITKHWRGLAGALGPLMFLALPWTRYAGYGVVRMVRPSAAESHAVWAEVWARRGEWQDGYPPAPAA